MLYRLREEGGFLSDTLSGNIFFRDRS